MKKLELSTYATVVPVSSDGKYAFASHFPNLAQVDLRIENPLTRIDLATWEVKQASGDYRHTPSFKITTIL